MDIMELGAIGELVGGFAVIATLIYLAMQIRQNTRSVEAAALDSSASAIIAIRQSIADSAEVAHLYHVGTQDPDELDDEERLRFRLLAHNAFWSFANSYRQITLAGGSEEEVEANLAAPRRLLTLPGNAWFWSQFKHEFDPSFCKEMGRFLAQTEG